MSQIKQHPLEDRYGEMYLSVVEFSNALGVAALRRGGGKNPETAVFLEQAQRMVSDAGIVGRYMEWYLVGRIGEDDLRWLLAPFLGVRRWGDKT